MTATGKKSAASEPDPSDPPLRILALLQLSKVAIADQLVHSIKCFRPAQMTQLLTLLGNLQAQSVLENVAAHFDRKLDVKDEMERYLHDLLKIQHYITHHNVEAELSKQMMQLYGAFGDGADRQLLTKVFQTIGFSMCATFCLLCSNLAFKYQQELLTLFAEDLSELRMWIHWLAKVRNNGLKQNTTIVDDSSAIVADQSTIVTPFENAIQFIVKTILERCTLAWLILLRPLSSSARLAVVAATNGLPSVFLKQLARFYETTGVSVQKYLELDPKLRMEMPLLLSEFPIATLQSLFAKFNSAKLIDCVVVGLGMLPKRELLRLIDALSIADNLVIDIFVGSLFTYKRVEEFTRLFLIFSAQSQLRFLDLLHVTTMSESPVDGTRNDAVASGPDPGVEEGASVTASEKGTDEDSNAWLVFDLFLNAHFNSCDVVTQKLSTLPNAFVRKMVTSIAKYTPEELAILGEGIESISINCLTQFLKISSALPAPETRQIMVKWVHDVPGDEATPIYDVLISHLEAAKEDSTESDKHKLTSVELPTKILNLITSLTPKDKRVLCADVLVRPSPLSSQQQHLPGDETLTSTADLEVNVHALNNSVLRYLCNCTIAIHKAIKLFRIIPVTKYEGLIFLLRTQRIPEQVAFSRLMLSLPSEANCRLLEKVHSLPADTLDLFFELLLLIPQIEYRHFTKLLISPNISPKQLLSFIQVAASLMNQASSRELVIFTAELPVITRNLFFDMLSSDPVKGLLLRIVAYSSKLPPELLHQMIALLHPMSWGTRSSFVEQIRALENTNNIQDLVDVARDLVADDLQILVLLFNILQVPVRICFITVFVPLSHHEKHLALGKLNTLPKAKLQSYCTEVCDRKHLSAVGSAFFRVFGVLDSTYQFTLLSLLQKESCWSIISLLADCVTRNPEPNLINGFAASLVLLTHETEFLTLRSVVEEALANFTSLYELVLVLCHFRNPAKLLEFLKFVLHLSKFARSTVLFRVLSKYKHTVFLYEMCRMLDLDDALFTLKRLDHLWQRRHEDLDSALEILSSSFNMKGVKIKDEFCNVVLGFHEQRVRVQEDPNEVHQEKCIIPKTTPTASDSAMGTSQPSQRENDDYHNILFIPSSRPISHPAVTLERYLQRAQPGNFLPQKWKQSLSLRGNNDSRTQDVEEAPGLGSARPIAMDNVATPARYEEAPDSFQPKAALFESDNESGLSELFALTESRVSLPLLSAPGSINSSARRTIADITESESEDAEPSEHTSKNKGSLIVGSLGAIPSNQEGKEEPKVLVATTLPPLVAPHNQHQESVQQDSARPRSSNSRLKTPTSASDNTNTCVLSRSESAPTTITPLEPYSIPQHQKPKRYRGLAAALDDDAPVVPFHVSRNHGASVFQKERASAEASSLNRIRFSKTHAAQAHVMAVRAQQALGKRDLNRHGGAAPLASPLLRPNRHTFEQAQAAMALAAKARGVDLQDARICHALQLTESD